ncbi:MAG: tetratricopeptide repeat protein [Spirochaetaceae bacterium]|jgi:tetratricopeptide (TPR) repeat protein|nr:tetratricopeptide repeat protein [Spirochaetaceae bacterium]
MKLKITVVPLLFTLSAFLSCATAGGTPDALSLDEAIKQSTAEVAENLPKGTRVAIAGFDFSNQNLSEYVMDELSGIFAADSNVELADRRNLDFVRKELNFQASGEVDEESAQLIGKFQGAEYVVTGGLINVGGVYRYRVNLLNVESDIQENSVSFKVRDDSNFNKLLAALGKGTKPKPAASYGNYSGTGMPKSAGAYLDRGIIFAMRGDYDMAIEDFSEAIKLKPEYQPAWVLRGRARFASVSDVTAVGENFSGVATTVHDPKMVSDGEKSEYDKVIADFTQAIKLVPDDATAYAERGDAYMNKGDYDRAIADYTHAIKLDPNDVNAYNGRGLAYRSKGDYNRAIADYNRAIKLNPNDAVAYSNRGGAYYSKDDNDSAIADYTHAIKLDPNGAVTYNNRGLAYRSKGDYNRAIADYTHAIKLDPNVALAYSNRGLAYYGKGDYDRAIADYNQAIKLDPNNAVLQDLLKIASNKRNPAPIYTTPTDPIYPATPIYNDNDTNALGGIGCSLGYINSFDFDKLGFNASIEASNPDNFIPYSLIFDMFFDKNFLNGVEELQGYTGDIACIIGTSIGYRIFSWLLAYAGAGLGFYGEYSIENDNSSSDSTSTEQPDHKNKTGLPFKVVAGFRLDLYRIFAKLDVSYGSIIGPSFGLCVGLFF